MAMAAPVSATWIPEDDLLLKNAVEAGASLEALAKGAVKFSRRFTYKELRDRWHSLLYDPDVTPRASARMFELELSGFSPSAKSIKENFKGHREFPEKRKCRSIRKQYYAMRKKLRSEFYASADLGFRNESSPYECHARGTDFKEPQDGNFISDSLALQEVDLDIFCNVFPETVRDLSASSAFGGTNNAYPVECRNPNGMLQKYEFPQEVSATLKHDAGYSSVPDVKCLKVSHTPKDSVSNFREHAAVEDSRLLHLPPGKRLFKSSEKKQLSSLDSVDDNPQNVCDSFGGSQHFDFPNSECNSPLQPMEFPSPQPNLPLWKTMQDISAPTMPVGMTSQNATQVAERMHCDGSTVRGESSSVFDVVHSGPLLGVEQHATDYVNPSTVSDGDFADLSDSLLNLSNEDEVPFMDVDVKDTVDRISCDNVDSILKNSSKTLEEKHMVKIEPDILMVGETSTFTKGSNDVNPTKIEVNPSLARSEQNVSCLEVNVPSTSGISSESREFDSGILCCTLNTEDPEIPCNDDIFLLIHPSTAFAVSTTPQFTNDSVDPPSTVHGKVSEQGLNFLARGKDSSRSFPWSQKVETSSLVETRLDDPLLGSRSELRNTNHFGVLPVNANKVLGDSSLSRLSHSTPNISTNRPHEEEVTRAQLTGADAPASLADMPQYTEAGLIRPSIQKPAINTSISNSEEPQSEDDVPYFSDIEAMMLEMDLDPPEQDSSIIRQVSRYHYDETKRTIIRLEQCARSCLQRTMTSQGAFAIFYGRHLKHYIRKTEVILGRSTDDLDVDIDLRKEGRANKISRRQAIMKMEANGSFSLRNIGKCEISVNGKLIATGQSLILGSSCLIEIRGMNFVFEINQKYVRRHLDVATRKGIEKTDKFDWLPEGDIMSG